MAVDIEKEKLLQQLLEIQEREGKPDLIDIYIVLGFVMQAFRKYFRK